MIRRWSGLFGVLAVSVACGSGGQLEEGAPAPESVARPAPETEAPPVASEPPSQGEAPPSQGEAPPEPPRASVRHASACSRTEYRQEGSLNLRVRFGADGLPREETSFFADGTPASRVVQQVESGRVLWRERFFQSRLERRETWRYGPSGELLQHEFRDANGEPTYLVSYVYDAQLRLEREDSSYQGVPSTQTLYTYSEQGLVRVARKDAGGPYIYSLTTNTYHPNGKLARSASRGEQTEAWSEFDTEGREVRSYQELDQSSGRSEQNYDARGLLARRLRSSGSASNTSKSEETFEYDAAGRQTLLRLAWDVTYFGDTPAIHVRETHRYEYDARGDLALETCDTNEDGVADWRRTFTRDPSGNLLEERLEGTARPIELGRVVYTYECHD